ncbi:hypothetical protein GCM10027031_21740 [Corynebacterium atrinae]
MGFADGIGLTSGTLGPPDGCWLGTEEFSHISNPNPVPSSPWGLAYPNLWDHVSI